MNYKKIYYDIIHNRLKNPIEDGTYTETHHIIPKSLGGTDESENLVKLTAKEHFVCHALLAEMYEEESIGWYKMNHAFMMMKANPKRQKGKRYFNSRLYELKKIDFSKAMSEAQSGEKNSQYGKPKSKGHIEKLKNTFLKKRNGELSCREKKIEEYKNKINTFTTVDGKYVNKQRRNKIKKLFNIDLETDFKNNMVKLKNMLNKLYNEEKISTTQLANIFKTNDETIRKYLIFLDIDRRTLSESLKNYCNTKN